MYAEGYTKSGIARKLGIGRVTVYKILEERDGQRWKREIKKLYELGFSKIEIARELGVSKLELDRILGNGQEQEAAQGTGFVTDWTGGNPNKHEKAVMEALDRLNSERKGRVTRASLHAELVMERGWGKQIALDTIGSCLEKGLILREAEG